MTGNSGTMESVISGAGIALAAALIMLVVIALYRSTGSADAAIALQSAAAEVSGDIGTIATLSVPFANNYTCAAEGITVRITADYVIVGCLPCSEFARPLTVRVYPGNYQGADGTCWNDTAGMREYFNATLGRPGTKELPLTVANGSKASALLEKASLEMDSRPVLLDPSLPLTIEKLFVFVHNASSGITESEPYVFIYQR
ncbi:MAG TPA: hypothetical protein VGJ92_10610 [Methanocella sp.]|jgi:hypothetical protein